MSIIHIHFCHSLLAGIMTTAPLEYHATADARRVFETNFFSVLDLVQLALPCLRECRGRVVNISSMVSIAGEKAGGEFGGEKEGF